MKKKLFVLFLVFSIVSCTKEDLMPATSPLNPIRNPPLVDTDREYFRDQSWQKNSTGYELMVQTQRLTDSAIKKGVTVQMAVFSGWSYFENLPFIINGDGWLHDTIDISYLATPGKLQLFAKTTANIFWTSDLFIKYY